MYSTAIVDFRIDIEEKNTLYNLGYEILMPPPSNLLYEAIMGHPDILLHIVDEENILVHKDMDVNFCDEIVSRGYNVYYSKNSLKSIYPRDIFFNAVNLKDYFIHKLQSTDENLLNFVKKKSLINVEQGYSKCSTAILSHTALITSDISIKRALKNTDIDVLLLPPGDIILPGLSYGFIGGTCGLIDKDTLGFFGDLDYYTYGNEVKNFLEKHNIKATYLRKGKLIDRGSLFCI